MSDRLLSALADSPEWLLHHLDFSKKEAEFVAMNRRSYELSSFMDERLVRASSKRELVRWSKLSAEVPIKSRPRLCFMFHSAYCCSTLFAKCVDWAGKILSYREPQILLEIALQKPGLPNSHYQDKSQWKEDLKTVIALLSKSFSPSELVLIKPCDTSNIALREILEVSPDSTSGLFLYSDLKSFLCSAIKSSSRRQWTRNCLNYCTFAFARETGVLKEVDTATLSDAQAAAYLWLWQMYHFVQLSQSELAPRLRSLSCDLFLQDPLKVLKALSPFFQWPFSSEELEKISQSREFSIYAKTIPRKGPLSTFLQHSGLPLFVPQAYNKDSRETLLTQIAQEFAPEVEEGLQWAEMQIQKQALPQDLPLPLIS